MGAKERGRHHLTIPRQRKAQGEPKIYMRARTKGVQAAPIDSPYLKKGILNSSICDWTNRHAIPYTDSLGDDPVMC